VTVALLWYPWLFLAIGIQAIGARLGWWIGDPNSNDGEETFATAIGLVGIAVVVGLAVWAALAVARRWSLPRWPIAAFVVLLSVVGIVGGVLALA
jgi:uncharacterized membrane protein